MMFRKSVDKIQRHQALKFTIIILKYVLRLLYFSIMRPTQIKSYAYNFAKLYSELWDYAEHSISNRHFNLPSALGEGAVQTVNQSLATLYKSTYACLSFGGSSGSILILLTAVLPKLQRNRSLVLFDEACHQSAIGGLIFGRWKAIRVPRCFNYTHGTVHPITFDAIKNLVEKFDPKNIAAIILVLPSYDGFRAKSEEEKIYNYAKLHGIYFFIDGAWDATAFRNTSNPHESLIPLCDAWLTSPHKRGLSPSSLGCMVTNNKEIARLWDEALDLGFRSSSISFVDIMITEHRIQEIINGAWGPAFKQADEAAQTLSNRIKEVHPDIYIVKPEYVDAESSDPAHILISTSKLTSFDARIWAKNLSEHFGLDVEKSTAQSLLLLCASPADKVSIEQTLSTLRNALKVTLQVSETL